MFVTIVVEKALSRAASQPNPKITDAFERITQLRNSDAFPTQNLPYDADTETAPVEMALSTLSFNHIYGACKLQSSYSPCSTHLDYVVLIPK